MQLRRPVPGRDDVLVAVLVEPTRTHQVVHKSTDMPTPQDLRDTAVSASARRGRARSTPLRSSPSSRCAQRPARREASTRCVASCTSPVEFACRATSLALPPTFRRMRRFSISSGRRPISSCFSGPRPTPAQAQTRWLELRPHPARTHPRHWPAPRRSSPEPSRCPSFDGLLTFPEVSATADGRRHSWANARS
jgi:hypothetical protein